MIFSLCRLRSPRYRSVHRRHQTQDLCRQIRFQPCSIDDTPPHVPYHRRRRLWPLEGPPCNATAGVIVRRAFESEFFVE